MKNLSFFSKFLFLVVVIFAASSCGKDDTVVVLPPTIDFLDEIGFTAADAEVATGETITFKVRAAKGDNPLKTYTVLYDGVALTTDEVVARVTVDGVGASANPALLLGDDVSGFTKEIAIKITEAGTYGIEVADDASKVAETSVDISFPTNTDPLAISFVEEAPYFWADASLTEPSTFKVKILVTAGASPLSSLTVYEDDVEITDLTRIKYESVDIANTDFESNPLPFLEDEKGGIEWEIHVVSSNVIGSNHNYKYEIAAEDGETVSVNLNISLGGGTFTGTLQEGILFNSAGPGGTGGLDLENGVGTGSSDPAAHIKDEGIDGGNVDTNWKKQISGVNGSVLRTPSSSLPEGWSFQTIGTPEEIVTAFDASAADEFTVSSTIEVGNVFLIKNGSKYFAVYVSQVNNTTGNDNSDNYVFDIKY